MASRRMLTKRPSRFVRLSEPDTEESAKQHIEQRRKSLMISAGAPPVMAPPRSCVDARSRSKEREERHRERLRSQKLRPENIITWPNRWRLAFQQEEEDNQVHRSRLGHMLKQAGHRKVNQQLVEDILKVLTPYKHLSAFDAFGFFSKYENRVEASMQGAFDRQAENGKIRFDHVEELVFELGYTPLPHSLAEVLEEAAASTGVELTDGVACVTYPVFRELADLLVDREGFSKSEAYGLEVAFRHFDSDDSGKLGPKELPPIVVWLGFCNDEQLLDRLLSDAKVGARDGGLDFAKFMSLMRRHRAIEYNYTLELFVTFDEDNDGFLGPSEMMVLFRHLRVPLLPEALFDAAEDCDLDYEKFTFSGFNKVFQLLRQREGFSSEDMKEIGEVFAQFDRHHRGEIRTRRVPHALRWLGFMLGRRANKPLDWRRTVGHRGRLCEAEFLKIMRDYQDEDLQETRQAFRQCAGEGGAAPMPKGKLRHALRNLNPCYLNDYQDWLSANLPGKAQSQQASFDFEDFRMLVRGCRDMVRDRFRRNHGFNDLNVSRLRTLFVNADRRGGAGTVPPAALIKLWASLCPAIETSAEVREQMRLALKANGHETSGLNWEGFMAVVRSFEDNMEEQHDQDAPRVCEELGLPAERVDSFLDVFMQYLLQGPMGLSAPEIRVLMGSPELEVYLAKPTPGGTRFYTDAEAPILKVRLAEIQRRGGIAGDVSQFIQLVKELRQTDIAAFEPDIKPTLNREKLLIATGVGDHSWAVRSGLIHEHK